MFGDMINEIDDALIETGLTYTQSADAIRHAIDRIDTLNNAMIDVKLPITIKYILWRHCILEAIALLERESVNGCNDAALAKLKELEIS